MATFSNGHFWSRFAPHEFMIGMRFLFVMKLSRFMVNPNSSNTPSISGILLKLLIAVTVVVIKVARLIIDVQAGKQSSSTALQEGSEILSFSSMLKKSSLRPEQILQALLEMTELILATHFCCFSTLE